MNRSDTIALILEHADAQGIWSDSYEQFLENLSDADLFTELDRLETIAVYGGF